MKNILSNLASVICSLLIFSACSDMNDKHDMFLAEGERIYIGKIDSLKVFPGDNRIALRFWASDPRCNSVGFYWFPFDDSLRMQIDKVSPTDSFEVIIGGMNSMKTITEGSYTLKAITYDAVGNYSVPFERNINIYGDRYRSTLVNRVISTTEYENESGSLELKFSDPLNEDDKGIEVSYTDRDGKTKKRQIKDAETNTPVYLTNIDASKGVHYRTIYLPSPLAIDTFYTEFSTIEITQSINVALNKPVKTSDILSSKYPGENAVDGVISNTSRWLSSKEGEHWLEIDLEQKYNINSFKTWLGAGGTTGYPVTQFTFQAEVNGEWQNIIDVINNSDPEYGADFPEVETSKVRYFVPNYSDNMVRLYEIAVYATIKY
jgi:hypothetical protein